MLNITQVHTVLLLGPCCCGLKTPCNADVTEGTIKKREDAEGGTSSNEQDAWSISNLSSCPRKLYPRSPLVPQNPETESSAGVPM